MRCVFIFLVLLLCCSSALAVEVDQVTLLLDVKSPTIVYEEITFFFQEETQDLLTYTLDDVNTLSVHSEGKDIPFTLDGEDITVQPTTPLSQLTLSFFTEAYLFAQDDTHHLFTEFFLPKADTRVEVRLPEGYGLASKVTRPKQPLLTTNGRQVLLSWDVQHAEDILVSVKFSSTTSSSKWPLLLLVLVVVLIAIIVHLRTKLKEKFLSGFRQDEQKVIGFLQQRKEVLQKDIQWEFGFSKAKTTRIIRVLEEKGLVSKEAFGRTNKLRWLR